LFFSVSLTQGCSNPGLKLANAFGVSEAASKTSGKHPAKTGAAGTNSGETGTAGTNSGESGTAGTNSGETGTAGNAFGGAAQRRRRSRILAQGCFNPGK
jgi:hypothetical protein